MSEPVRINRIEQCYRDLLKEGREVLRLFDGNPIRQGFQFPPEILKKVYADYFSDQQYEPDPKGDIKGREAVVQYYASRGISYSPDTILLTAGTSETFFYLFSILTKPGDNILVPNPAYPLFDYIARLTHTESRHYRLEEERGWSIDFENLEGQIDSRTKAILIISPNNPTGWVASEEEWKRVGMMAKKYDLAVIHDEVFSEFVFDVGARFPSPKNEGGEPPLQFTLNGISKMFALPSLKLGWIAVSGESKKVAWAMDQLETISDTFLSTHTPIQQALPLLFKEGKQFCEQYKKEVTARRDLAIKILKQSDKIRFVEPRGGFYLMAEVETDLSEEQFVIELMQKTGVFVHPGYFFDYEKESRIVISFLVERERLQKGLTKLVEFLSL